MSTLRLLNAQIGTSVTPSQNFTWYQPTIPDGSIRLGVGNSGATTKDMIKVSGSDIILDTPLAIATPPQFDNSKKLATTDFLQRALGNYQSSSVITTPITLIASDMGKTYSVNAGGSIKLPSKSSVPAGSSILISSQSSWSLTLTSTDTIFNGNTSVATVPFNAGDWVIITLNNTNGEWQIAAGNILNRYSYEFSKSLSPNGYQRLPSGLIIQWGYDSNGTGTDKNISYPIAFPNAVLNVTTTIQFGSAPQQQVLSVMTGNVGQLGFFSVYPRFYGPSSGGNAVQPFNWTAIGY